jgi:hypothetical protein
MPWRPIRFRDDENSTFYIVTYTRCGVTNNTTRVRIGYRIYSLWRFTAATQVTITMNTIALSASQIPLTELHWTDVSLRGLTDEDSLRRPTGVD